MRHSRLVLAFSVSVLALALTACSSGSPSFVASGARASASASAAPSAAPSFNVSANAQSNLDYVKGVVQQVVGGQGNNADAAGIAQSLVAGGVPAESISYTSNSTAIGLKADSVSIAVLIGSECILSQYGDAIGGLTVVIQPALTQGGCLLGGDIRHP